MIMYLMRVYYNNLYMRKAPSNWQRVQQKDLMGQYLHMGKQVNILFININIFKEGLSNFT